MGVGKTGDVLGRLVSMAALLVSLTAGSSGALTTLARDASTWERSDAATFSASSSNISAASAVSTTPVLTSIGVYERALSEVKITRAIVSARELWKDRAFAEYLDTIDRALVSYEHSANDLSSLTTAFALARGALHESVTTAVGWLAISEYIRDNDARFVALPDRFVSQTSFDITREAPPTGEDLATWRDMDDASASV